MKTSIWTRLIVTALAGCAVVALGAPAMAQSDDLTLRRDASKAVPFVAELDGEAPTAADGFDWGDAGVGAGLGIATAMVILVAARALHGPRLRPLRAHRPGSPTASG
jgi:hypothetical protein